MVCRESARDDGDGDGVSVLLPKACLAPEFVIAKAIAAPTIPTRSMLLLDRLFILSYSWPVIPMGMSPVDRRGVTSGEVWLGTRAV